MSGMYINNPFIYSGRKRNVYTSKTTKIFLAKQGIKFHISLSLLSVGGV